MNKWSLGVVLGRSRTTSACSEDSNSRQNPMASNSLKSHQHEQVVLGRSRTTSACSEDSNSRQNPMASNSLKSHQHEQVVLGSGPWEIQNHQRMQRRLQQQAKSYGFQ